MNKCKHKKDKYGCVKGCKEYYPVISRESIIAEMDYKPEEEEHIHTMEQFFACEECKEKIGKLMIKAFNKI